jgi:anti-sigma factor (TIGR02949 family)
MSCGKHHDTDCAEIIARVYEYLDGELTGGAAYDQIRVHLHECGPCLREYGLEEAVKALVRRSCRDHAPEDLRRKVLLRLSQVRIELHAD